MKLQSRFAEPAGGLSAKGGWRHASPATVAAEKEGYAMPAPLMVSGWAGTPVVGSSGGVMAILLNADR
jgi:hypothetical protein